MPDNTQEKNTFYKHYFDSARDAILIIDLKGLIIDANKMALDEYGYTYEEFMSLNIIDLRAEKSIYIVNRQMNQAEECGILFETLHQHKNGNVFPVEVTSHKITRGDHTVLLRAIRNIQKRNQMQEKVKIEKMKYQELINNMSSGLVVFKAIEGGKDFIVVDFNYESQQFEHIKKERVIGKRLTKFMPIFVKKDFFDIVQRVWKSGDSENMPDSEYKYEIDGKQIRFWVDGFIYKLSSGEIVLIYNDATDRKQKEEYLYATNELLNGALDSSDDPIVFTDTNYNITNVNRSFENIIGYSKKEVMGVQILKAFKTKNTKDCYLEEFLLNDKIEKTKCIIEVVTKQGKIIVLDFDISSIKGKDGSIIGYISVSRDITAKRFGELEKLKLLRALEYSPNSIIITDNEGKIEYANPKITELTGYSFDELIGGNPRILNSNTHSKDFYSGLWTTIKSGAEWHGEFRNIKKNGELYWETASISSVKDSEGHILNFIAIKVDITEKKRVEKELLNTNKNLVTTIKKLKETQSQLIQQEKLAGIGQLAAGVAHEINNPLGYISSNFNTLKSYINSHKSLIELYDKIDKEKFSGIDIEHKEIMDDIIKIYKEKNIKYITEDMPFLLSDCTEGLGRVREIVNGLRLFSRVDQLNSFEDYDLNEGIKTTLIVVNNEIKFDARVVVNYGETLTVEAFGGQINQVLLNIIINASYAISEKKYDDLGLIKIDTYCDKEYIYVKVEDDGIGIPEDKLDKIFEPFYTTKPIGEGTGLGLGIAYDIIVNKHKGKIWVESVLGQGSSFYIKVPIIQLIT